MDENDKLKEQQGQKGEEYQNMYWENEEIKKHAQDQKDKLEALEDDKQRLADTLLDKVEECEEMHKRAEQMEQEHQDLFDKRKMELEAYLKKIMETERQDFLEQFEQERQQYGDKIEEYEQAVVDLENRQEELIRQNERLTDLVHEKIEEIELWKSKYATLDANRLAEIEELKKHLDNLKEANLVSSNYKLLSKLANRKRSSRKLNKHCKASSFSA